jgi:hypothetical protein
MPSHSRPERPETNRNINTVINNNNNNNNIPVTLLLSVSCTVFDDYNNIPLTLNSEFIRSVTNMPVDEGMKRLSQHICTYVLVTIYDDLEQKQEWDRMRELIKKSQLFHIHGRTVGDIIYPNPITDDPHGHHGRVVFVCTHC